MEGTQRARLPAGSQEPPFRIQLLGRVRAAWCGREIHVGGRNAWGLLALIALRPRARSRESIAADLWPDGNPASAAALRQALWLVRSGLLGAGADPDALLEIDDEGIGLREEWLVDLDAMRFETLALSGPSRCEEAALLYGGDLAEGLTHECFARDRERLAGLYEDVLADVAAVRLGRNELEPARLAALRLVGLDPLREEAHAVLIDIYSRRGSRSQVVRQYRRLRTLLREEIGVDPLPETEAIYRAALDRTWQRSAQHQLATALAATPGLAATYKS